VSKVAYSDFRSVESPLYRDIGTCIVTIEKTLDDVYTTFIFACSKVVNCDFILRFQKSTDFFVLSMRAFISVTIISTGR
jgi:hypothetical protein